MNIKHGFAGKGRPLVYRIWRNMHTRCNNPNRKAYADYGGRGIKVCERWSGNNGFVNFLADMGHPPPEHCIERVDNDQGYCKSNCIWVTKGAQSKNRRHNWRVRIDGQVLNASEAAMRLGFNRDHIAAQLRKSGRSKQEIITI